MIATRKASLRTVLTVVILLAGAALAPAVERYTYPSGRKKQEVKRLADSWEPQKLRRQRNERVSPYKLSKSQYATPYSRSRFAGFRSGRLPGGPIRHDSWPSVASPR
jgi:hypothetical protein